MKNKQSKVVKNDDLSDEAVAHALRDAEAEMGRLYERLDLLEQARIQTVNNLRPIREQVNFYRAEHERRKEKKEMPEPQEVKS